MSSSEDKQSNNNNSEEKPQQNQETYYQRKKNWIGGIDNDAVNLFLAGAALVVGSIALYPTAKDIWNNLTNRYNQQQYPPAITNGHNNVLPPPNEPYIPPTEPVQPAVPEQPQPIEQQQQQPAQQEETKEVEEEEDVDGRFYEAEKRRLQKRQQQGKYESPFGKHIGGLG